MNKMIFLFLIINYIKNAFFITNKSEICLLDDLNFNKDILLKFKFSSDNKFTVNIIFKDKKGKIINSYKSVNEKEKNIAYTHKNKGDIEICLNSNVNVETEYNINSGNDPNSDIIAKSSEYIEINTIVAQELENFNNLINESEKILIKEDDIFENNKKLNSRISNLCLLEIFLIAIMFLVQYIYLNRTAKKRENLN